MYGEKEITFLKNKDEKLATAIDRIGLIERALRPDLFEALINSIVGQQISTKAHVTVWNRMKETFGDITPTLIQSLPDDELQAVGLSYRKVSYMKQSAEHVLNGTVDLETLPTKSDAEVCEALCALPGIGVWTAEMLMTFSMGRMDILSYGDFAIRKGMRMLYRHRELTPKLFAKYKRRYSPYASVAALYFWAIAGGALPELTDPGANRKKK